MTKQIETNWLSLYIFYNPPWELFLVNSIKIFIEDIEKENVLEGYFFIRYWENGPHIRLRFLAKNSLLKNEVKIKASIFFANYLESQPSQPYFIDNNESVQRQFDYLEWHDYKPETERYGGKHSIFFAEKYFESSSKIILTIIGNKIKDWCYETTLGVAIEIHLTFALTIKMNSKEAVFFYNSLFQAWLPRAYNWNSEMSLEEALLKKTKILESFEETFDKQKDTILPFFENRCKILTSETNFENRNEWQNWIIQIHEINYKIIELKRYNRLKIPKWYKEKCLKENISKYEFYIYESFFHMDNNRLGVINQDEGFLAFVLMKCFERVKI